MQLDPQIILHGLAVRALKLDAGKNIKQTTSGLILRLHIGTVEVDDYTPKGSEGRRFSPTSEHEWMELYEAERLLEEHVLDVLDNLPFSILECVQIHAQCLMLLELLKRPVPPGVPLRSLALMQQLTSTNPWMKLTLFGNRRVCHLEVDPDLYNYLEGAPEIVLQEMRKVKKAFDRVETETDLLLTQVEAQLVQEWNAEVRKNPPLDPKDDERL